MEGLHTVGKVNYAGRTFACKGKQVKKSSCKKGAKCPKIPHVYCSNVGAALAKKKKPAAKPPAKKSWWSKLSASEKKERIAKMQAGRSSSKASRDYKHAYEERYGMDGVRSRRRRRSR